MKERVNVLIMGGDTRYLEVIRVLSEYGANLFLCGYDQKIFQQSNIEKVTMNDIDFTKMDLILLAISGTDSEGRVAADFSNEKLLLTEEMILTTPEHCTICTGVINSYLEDICRKRTLIDLYARDDVAIYNSIPTAEGTLMKAMQETDYTMHHADVLVLGFGRVGFTIANLFAAVGANVTVGVRKQADIARINQLKLRAIQLKNLKDHVSNVNVLINSIPHLLIDQSVIEQMNEETLIIDLSTQPGGVDFAAAERHRIKAIHYLGIPGDVAPKTGGQIMANAVIDTIESMKK